MTRVERIAQLRRMVEGAESAIEALPAGSRRKSGLQAYAEKCRERLAQMTRHESAGATLTLPQLARRAYMTKSLNDRVEIYDAGRQLLGAVPQTRAEQLADEIRASGRRPGAPWPGYKGGVTREPGTALWWDKARA